MATFTFSEKQLIEDVLGMGGGYFLDFSNRQFEEFMKDVVNYNIYTKYSGLSKAKIFRQFMQDESIVYVGKSLILALNYMRDKGLIGSSIQEQYNQLYIFAQQLLGKEKTIVSVKQEQVSSQPKVPLKQKVDFVALQQSLLDIEKLKSQQDKGYAFEKYLNNLFNAFCLSPRASYKTEYDQIDGSFELNGETILIEAKYKSKTIPKDDLILFSNKVSAKSHYARGLFISLSKIDEKSIEYYIDKSPRLVILTVEELFLICQNQYDFPIIIGKKFRALNETGYIFKHILQLDM